MSEQQGTPISHRASAATLLARPWRVGGSLGRTVFVWPGDDDSVIGMLDTRELAAAVVDAHNLRLVRQLLAPEPSAAPTYAETCRLCGLPVEAE